MIANFFLLPKLVLMFLITLLRTHLMLLVMLRIKEKKVSFMATFPLKVMTSEIRKLIGILFEVNV